MWTYVSFSLSTNDVLNCYPFLNISSMTSLIALFFITIYISWVNLMMEHSHSTIWQSWWPILYTDEIDPMSCVTYSECCQHYCRYSLMFILHKHKKPSNHLMIVSDFVWSSVLFHFISIRSLCYGFFKYLVHLSEVNSLLRDCAKPILVEPL